MSLDLEKILKERFGFAQFRGSQAAVLEAVLQDQSVLAIMPTGSGKSLCYQLPATLVRGLVLVISPLIALMQDQVAEAKKFAIKSRFINSSLSRTEREAREAEVAAGQVQLLFVTPERFRKPAFLEMLSKVQVKLLVVDEAHCISAWGHDFRPEYTRLGEIRKQLGAPTTLLLTATATEKVRGDILAQMDLADAKLIMDPIARDNLDIRSHDIYGDEQKIQRLIFHLQGGGQPAIVYFALIGTLERLAASCRSLGVKLTTYHGSLPAHVRKQNQEKFFSDEISVIFATPAFGLGINKPNVRQVLHAELPGAIEAYFQEVGRAGRDGLPAECHLLYDEDDAAAQMDFIKWANPDAGFIATVYRLLKTDADKVKSGGEEFIRRQMNFYNSRDFRVETTLQLLKRWDCLWVSDQGLREYEITAELPEDLMQSHMLKERVKTQSQKLLELIQLVKNFETPLNSQIYNYFG